MASETVGRGCGAPGHRPGPGPGTGGGPGGLTGPAFTAGQCQGQRCAAGRSGRRAHHDVPQAERPEGRDPHVPALWGPGGNPGAQAVVVSSVGTPAPGTGRGGGAARRAQRGVDWAGHPLGRRARLLPPGAGWGRPRGGDGVAEHGGQLGRARTAGGGGLGGGSCWEGYPVCPCGLGPGGSQRRGARRRPAGGLGAGAGAVAGCGTGMEGSPPLVPPGPAEKGRAVPGGRGWDPPGRMGAGGPSAGLHLACPGKARGA